MTTPLSRALLWDLDGTLVDSAELHWLSWRDTMEAEGPISYQEFLDSFGQKNDRSSRAGLPRMRGRSAFNGSDLTTGPMPKARGPTPEPRPSRSAFVEH